MAGDRGVGGVGQADLGQAHPSPAHGIVGRGAARKEALQERRVEQLASQLGLDRPADDLRPAAQHGHRRRLLPGLGEEGLLGRAAGVAQGHALGGVQAVHALGKRGRDRIGQGQVHVVATQEDVLADSQTGECEVAPLVGHGDQGEVGRAAADVADQDDVADLDMLPPPVALGGKPGIEGRLGLLQERDLLEPGLARGLHGQLAGHGVERGGDGEQHLLVLQPLIGLLAGDPGVPDVAEMLEIGRRRVDRRDLRHTFQRGPGQDRAAAIDPGVRQPALGRADQPPRHLRPMLPGERADHAVRRRLPGKVERAGGKLLG